MLCHRRIAAIQTPISVLPNPLSAARAALELQHALAASGLLPHVPCMEVPSFAAQLHGSFADLAAQLQECVRLHHEGETGHIVCSSEHGNREDPIIHV